MERRNFLKNTGIALSVAPALLSTMNTAAATIKEDAELSEITIEALHKKYEVDVLTAERAVKKYLTRIEEIDKVGPALN